MFKQLTQIGKNFTDELAKGLNDELNGINSEQLDTNGPYADLPKDIQIKLRKFEKYEQKYPLLLQAYKNEKIKNEKLDSITRILSENTPVSDLNDLESLTSYFENVEQKTKMLNEEVKRLTVENTKLSHEAGTVKEDEAEKLSGDLQRSEMENKANQEEIKRLKQELDTQIRLAETFKRKIDEISNVSLSNEPNSTKSEIEKDNEPISKENNSTGGSKRKSKKKKGKSSVAAPQKQNDERVQAEEKQVKVPANEISECITLQFKLEALQSEYDKLKAEYIQSESSQKEQTELRAQLKAKDEELENVRDMLRDVGNNLVEAKNQLKEAGSAAKELSELQLKTESLKNETAERIKRYESKQNELSNELTSIKKTETTLKNTVSQKEKIIDFLEKQVKEYSAKESEYKGKIDASKREFDVLSKKIGDLNKDLDKWKLEAKKNTGNLENYIKENGKLSERLEVLQAKLDTVQNLKANTSDQVESIKKQCEELRFKLKDSNKKIISLEDELNENANILQERNRETNTMRKLINELQNDKSSRVRDLESKIHLSMEEKSKIENDLQLELARKMQDIKDLKGLISKLQSEKHEQVLHAKQYISEIEELKLTNQRIMRHNSVSEEDSVELNSIVRSLKEALTKSERKQREVQDENVELKELNNAVNKKFDRLSKNYKNLASQMSKSKDSEIPERPTAKYSRSNSIVEEHVNSPGAVAESDLNDKIAYIKNVLLGFLENKEQRVQLLPVVSTLLQLDSNDEKRLLVSLR